MPETKAPFRAEHVGSLLRPKELLADRAAFDAGKLSMESLDAAADKAIDKAIAMQADLGFHALTDGEYRRGMFWGEFFQTLNGMEERDNIPVSKFRDYVPDVMVFHENGGWGRSCVCTGRISHSGTSSLLKEWTYTRDHANKLGREAKLTMISPVWYHLRYKEGEAYPSNAYSSDKEYFADIAAAFRAELDILYDAGVRNVQIDDPNLAYFCSQVMIDGWAADPANKYTLDELFETYIAAYNDCLRDHKDKIHFGLHLCRGNFKNSRHFAEGSYDRIAAKLFNQVNVHTYYLEYDTERSGGFECLAHLPADKRVVLGIITSKFAELENKADMEARVRQAAKFMARGGSEDEAMTRISVSPQCGFASNEEGNAISWDGMVGKLGLVREIANEMWPGEP
ncbi:hypothetical protein CcaverHIS002_0200460 [Cutaneotrichosporon cavernicola]|uniref:Cobalamin-independent methionine synthase MetE C-terminal/archaeal domain-containing protein n=1 Tax=Cutaneotrichosporon cavernicola TaxID=279322 RepID=A0AA48L2F2_9TREE|nr:uncharacterized protein CcaverHIS019_0200500 [Cutaneotrichosporon cavernicola]BEI80886.1 hypothetical protein CcaverHIS002_0200460 [Cutaneotrichosporon cavernicola]BEI88688.1 hypothetical protein CcaverHIS019_0200500 [Cutaneotrichosporon cavernicola]BEI96462.1 hypothetical protein CcaverHIS631_0200510 [Cutaneotrichosporon cavernicola]BEJ04234.1 hypothetical protein CcaverHIS641_0200510 [Cutaneotrichosporon cavernicola]